MSTPPHNPRPLKRQRTEKLKPSETLEPLPPPVLLVSLPGLLAHPPTHQCHPQSLHLSLLSVRKCLSLNALSPELECRAWTCLAELGMNVIDGGFNEKPDHPWASGIEKEVETAISKGLLLSQKHASLRTYWHHLSLLHARMSHQQHNYKFARNLMKRVLSSFTPNDPPSAVYSAHMILIAQLADPSNPSAAQDVHAAIDAAKTLQTLATSNGHTQVVLLTHIAALIILVNRGLWTLVPQAIAAAESALDLTYPPPPAKDARPEQKSQETEYKTFEDTFESLMAIHTLILSLTFYTHAGSSSDVAPRFSHLHALLDSGALDVFPDGILTLDLPGGPPLTVQTTHPRVLFYLGFLISSISKRDAVGRRPKRKVFAAEGLVQFDKDTAPPLACPPWASLGWVEEVGERLAHIKADLMSELVAVSIMRSEFDAAEEHLAALIAHTRGCNLWPAYAPRVTLHHAHLAHALGHSARALTCYRVAAHLAPAGQFVHAAALAGQAALLVGLARGGDTQDTSERERRALVREAANACVGKGGTLEAVGQILEACLAPEILKAKQHLKQALTLATRAQDNHLRALVLALIATHYFHTAGEHAQATLAVCDQLAAGLGAPADKTAQAAGAGNAPLRLWVGERVLELYRRAGKSERARKQAGVNAELVKEVERIARRPSALGDPPPE